MSITAFQKRLVALLSESLPLVERPYLELAQRLGCSEEEVIQGIKELIEKKIIRRFGATVRHDRSGYRGNVMVAWIVPEEHLEEIGKKCATYPFITHCYVRKTAPDWPYNFYTMIHAEDEEACQRLVKKLSQDLGLSDYELLFTEKEIIRRTRRYFEFEKEV